MSDEMDHEDQSVSSTRTTCPFPTKRTKKVTTNGSTSSDADMAGSASKDEEEDPIDLGKVFISLTKPELITLLHDIVARHPDLKRSIPSLLPKPTIDAISTKLTEVESRLLESIPNKRTNREEYIWNRVRWPIHEYVNECLGLLKLWTKADEGFEQAQIHTTASNQFSFLYLLTLSIKKVDSCLPPVRTDTLNSAAAQPLHTVLVPDLLQVWKQFIEKIYYITSTTGIVLSEASIEKWFGQLDELAAHEHAQFMGPIRELAKYRFGDIVRSRRSTSHYHALEHQQAGWNVPPSLSPRLTSTGYSPYGQSVDEML